MASGGMKWQLPTEKLRAQVTSMMEEIDELEALLEEKNGRIDDLEERIEELKGREE